MGSACSNEPAVLEGKECSSDCVRAIETKWQDKCLWDGCQMCNSCTGSLKEENKIYVEDKDCPSSCVDATGKSWFDKCFWEQCQTCSACLNEPAVLEGKQCSASCVRATESEWQEKCLWGDCQMCNSCSGVSLKEQRNDANENNDCPSSCADATGKSWFDKCFWEQCQTCNECSDEAAVLEGRQCPASCVRAIETQWQDKCLWDDCQLCSSCGASSLTEENDNKDLRQEATDNEATQESLCAVAHTKNMCNNWRKAGKGCNERWDKVCPGVQHPWGRNDVTPKETCGYCAWANPNKSKLQRSLTEVKEKDLCKLGQSKRQMCNAWLRMGKKCNESWADVCLGVEHPWGTNHITPMDGCGYCDWAKKKKSAKHTVLAQTLSTETPVKPEMQIQVNAATLDEAGYQAVASRKSNAEMNSFIRQVILARGGRITDKEKFQSMVPAYSGVQGVSHYPRLLKELKHADWIERADWSDVGNQEEQNENEEEKED